MSPNYICSGLGNSELIMFWNSFMLSKMCHHVQARQKRRKTNTKCIEASRRNSYRRDGARPERGVPQNEPVKIVEWDSDNHNAFSFCLSCRRGVETSPRLMYSFKSLSLVFRLFWLALKRNRTTFAKGYLRMFFCHKNNGYLIVLTYTNKKCYVQFLIW